MHICFFDIDGTLILTGGAGQAAFAEAFVEDFGIEKWNGRVRFSGRSDRAIVADLFAEHGIANSDGNWSRFVAGYLGRLPQSLAESDGQILPGVVPLLKTLASREDVALGVLTGNMHAGAAHKLAHYNLDHFFEFGGYGDALLDRDEIAAVALTAAKEYLEAAANGKVGVAGAGSPALPPADFVDVSLVVIGDTEHDVRCARAIKATAVAVATGFTDRPTLIASEPDLLLDDLSDLTPLLELLSS